MPERRRPFAASAAAVAIASLALVGCTATPPASAPTPDPPTTSVEPAAVEPAPLTCEDLVPAEKISAALTGADGVAPHPVAALRPDWSPISRAALIGAGGLACSWRVGAPAGPTAPYGASGWAYLTVSVLPGAAGEFQPWAYGDAPAELDASIAGSPSVATCGDPGCLVTAPVGDTWVEVELSADGWNADRSIYAGLDTPSVLGRAESVAESVFGALGSASPEELAWPVAPGVPGTVDCGSIGSGLEPVGDLVPGTGVWFGSAAERRAGLAACALSEPSFDERVTVGAGLGGALATVVSSPDYAATLEPVSIPGGTSTTRAGRYCAETSGFCVIVFTLGDDAYEVQSRTDALAAAAAIVAAAG